MKQFIPESALVDAIALVVMLAFAVLFVVVIVRVFRKSKKPVHQHLSELPLKEDQELSAGEKQNGR